jgi:RimJ/RimL family protein N-acetyltransferase
VSLSEPSFRRRGLAIEALQLMLGYVTGRPDVFHVTSTSLPESPLNIPVQRLVARIGTKNTASIHLFQKLGFQITKHVDIFDQVEMRKEDL